MRRPVVGVFLAFAGGVGFEYYFDINGCILMMTAFVSAFFCIFIFVQKNADMAYAVGSDKRGLRSFRLYAGLFLMLFCLGGFCLWHEDSVLQTPLAAEQLPVMIKGNVISAEKKEAAYYKLHVEVADASEVSGVLGASGHNNGESRDSSLKGLKNKRVLVNVYEDISEIDSLDCYGNIVGRTIIMTGELSHPQGRRNPRTFDYSLYLKSRGISLTMVCDAGGMHIAEERVSLIANRIAVFKCRLISQLEASMADAELSGLAVGMLLGDKTEIEDETYESFQRNGTAHILAISGLHIGAIYICINSCVRICAKTLKAKAASSKRRKDRNDSERKAARWVQQLFIMAILAGYAAMTGFAPSVVRAVSMILLHILSKLLYRRYDMLTAASLVAVLALVKNPFMLFNTGFQLSYLAIFSLSVILPVVASLKQNPWLAARIEHNKYINVMIDVFTPVAALQIGMTPLTAYVFNYFSLGGILANIPIIFLSGFIIPLGLMLMPLGALLPFASGMPGLLLQGGFDTVTFLMKLMINLMEGINSFFYQDGMFSFNIVSPSIWLMCMYYGVIFYFSSELARVQLLRKQRVRLVFAAIAIVLGSSVLQTADFIRDDFRDAQLVFIDVGQGDALHIRTPSGKNILIDGGGSANYNVGKKTLMPYFLKNGVSKIDLAIATHLHMDHYKGLCELAQCIPVERFGTYEGKRALETEITSDMAIKPGQIIYLSKGQRVQVDKDVYVEILWPEGNTATSDGIKGKAAADAGEEEDENTSSLIIRVVYAGISVLMTGDIDCDGEHILTGVYTGDNALQSDILKVAHHGSKYSSSDDFIDAVKPRAAVIQVGKNNYGHPDKGVIEKYVKKDIIVVRNDLSGAIGVKDIDENRFSMVTMLKP